MRRSAYIVLITLLGLAIFIACQPRELIAPEARKLENFPSNLGSWRMSGNSIFDAPTLKVLRPSDYLMRSYVNAEGVNLGLYIGYHSGGPESGPIHSPRNCLPGSGWGLISTKEMQLPVEQEIINLNRTVYAKDGQELIFYYWYQMRDKSISSDLSMKLAELTGVLLDHRKDVSFIRISLPNALNERADGVLLDFLRYAMPVIHEFLPR